MLYWYRDMILDDFFKNGAESHKLRVERYYRALPKSRIFSEKKRCWEHLVGQKNPWVDYVVVVKASNPDNLFEVMGVRQWMFRHYEKMDVYVIGLFATESAAVASVATLLSDGYADDSDFDPRSVYDKEEDYDTYTEEQVFESRRDRKKRKKQEKKREKEREREQ